MFDNQKKLILPIFIFLGLVLINFRLGVTLFGFGLPVIIIIMILSLPLVMSAIVVAVILESIIKTREIAVIVNYNIFNGLSILIAEENEVNRQILGALLEKTGISIDFVEDGNIAVLAFKENPDKYSLIFMDSGMSGMNGFEASQAIRDLGTEEAKKIPIIGMIDDEVSEEIEKCFSAGMNDYIERPFDPDDLYLMIKRRALFFGKPGEAHIIEDLKQGLAWDLALSLGNEKLDYQHQQIFLLLGQIVRGCSNGFNAEELEKYLDFLLDYTVTHFEDEEELMLQYNFMEYRNHKKMHDDFKNTVKGLEERFQKCESLAELNSDLSETVVKWLTNHIMYEDRKIASFLRTVTAEEKS